MIRIDNKQVIFSTTFFADHKASVVIDNIPELESVILRFSFGEMDPDGGGGGISFAQSIPSVLDLIIKPNHKFAQQANPTEKWHKPDGTPLYLQYAQQAIGDASLIHFSILKD